MTHKHDHAHDQKEKLFYTCEEARFACDKKQYGDLTLWEKIRLKVHMFYCDYCRTYAKRNEKLSQLFKKVGIQAKTIKPLDDATKVKMKESFDKELKSI
jgi:hypothetical protein